jgi:carbonic anhydrase
MFSSSRLIAVILTVGFSFSAAAKVCQGFGPQTPRDLSVKTGSNPVNGAFAPQAANLNLCNLHFHKNAEHKAAGFSLSAGAGEHGGWKCNGTPDLTEAQLKPIKDAHCDNLKPGDSIEVHWVHSSCNVAPGKGLGACLSEACANPQLRVETKVFLLVNDKKATQFQAYADVKKVKGYHQAKALPNRDDAVQFLGSTTGPQYDETKCSPLGVTWNVSQSCEVMDINSVHKWCKSNKFEEKHAHGVRQIVTSPELLSEIK